jgi:quinol monooxygenase YgiN
MMTRAVCLLTTFALATCCLAGAPSHAPQEKNAVDPVLERLRAIPGQAGKPFSLLVHFKVKRDQVEAVLAAAKKAVPSSRAEKGCAAYDVQQNLEDPTEFFVLETWRNLEALRFHSGTDHFDDFVKVIRAAVDEPPKIALSLAVVPAP